MIRFGVKMLTAASVAAVLGAAIVGCSHQDATPPPAPAVAPAPQEQSAEDAKAKGMAADMARMHGGAAPQQQH